MTPPGRSDFQDVQTFAVPLESAGLVQFTASAPGVDLKLTMSPREAHLVAEQIETAATEVEDA